MNRLPQRTADPAAAASELFRTHQPRLRRQLTTIVQTSAANIDDACAYAWMQLLRCPPKGDQPFSWLLTVAVRYAIKLDREVRRDLVLEPGEQLGPGPADPHNPVLQRELMLDAAETVQRANLTDRESRMLSLHVMGYCYEEISALTADSVRTVERQLLRARRKVREAHE